VLIVCLSVCLRRGCAIANGFRENQSIPTLVQALSANPAQSANTNPVFITTSHSSNHSITINQGLQMFSFGLDNSFGELGNGTAGVQALVKCRINNQINLHSAATGNQFTVTLCKGVAPAQLTPKPIANANNEAVNDPNQPTPEALFSDYDVNNAGIEEASLQIAKLLQIEANANGEQVIIQTSNNSDQDLLAQTNFHNMSNEEALALGNHTNINQLMGILQTASNNPTAPTTTIIHSSVDEDNNTISNNPEKGSKSLLPAGWKKVLDEKSGRHYYYHTQTKQTTWKRPKE
jgi:hypothetical protein